MGRKKKEVAEDWCFVCKDGGSLVICDYKGCLKSYHSDCVPEDGSLMKNEEKWICNLHFCSKCNKAPKYYCLCCPFSICITCLYEVEFAIIKGDKGLCEECLELVLLIEEDKDLTSNGCKIDFTDPQSEELFFYEYWLIVKRKERLTSDQVISASNKLKMGENFFIASDSDEIDRGEEKRGRKRKRSKGKSSVTKCLVKSKRKGVIGWGSKPLLEFLASIGQNTTKIGKHAVATIITEYCKEHHLFCPERKREMICDSRLQALLGRKSVGKTELLQLLTTHLAEDLDYSKGTLACDEDVSVACKTHLRSSSGEHSHSNEVVAHQITEAQNAEPVGNDSTGTNEQQHNVGTPESPVVGTFEDECQMNSFGYDDLADIEECIPLLHWCEKRERSKRDLSMKKDGIASGKPLQSLQKDLVDEQSVVPSCKVYSRRNQLECRDGSLETSPERTSNGDGISNHIPLDQPELVNVVPITRDNVYVNALPDASAVPTSGPSTDVFQSEVPEVSAPLTSTIEIIDVKNETDIDLFGEAHAFFANLRPLLDESITISLSPDEIMEAKSCLNNCCLMTFEQLMRYADGDQFHSTLDLLLKHKYFPNHMVDMVTNLKLKFSSNKCLYSQCQDIVRKGNEEREHVEPLKKKLEDECTLHQEIEMKIKAVDEEIEKLITELRNARKLRRSLQEQSKSLRASSTPSRDAFCQYQQNLETSEKDIETGQRVMKEISEFWDNSRMDILNLLVDMLP